jgi:hypothetical protein
LSGRTKFSCVVLARQRWWQSHAIAEITCTRPGFSPRSSSASATTFALRTGLAATGSISIPARTANSTARAHAASEHRGELGAIENAYLTDVPPFQI